MAFDAATHPILQAAIAPFVPAKTQATEADLERLNDAHQSLLRVGPFDTCPDVRAYIRATNVLVDACIQAGMSHDYPDHEAWAAERVTRWLVEA